MTNTQSEAAAYEFTTLTAIPGVIEYNGARIQLLDLPGIVEGASQGRGRGRQVVSSEQNSPMYETSMTDNCLAAKTADVILIMLDAGKSDEQKRLLEHELDAVGIRLNARRPDVVFKKKSTGGLTINCTVKLTKTDEKMIRNVLASCALCCLGLR
jgi:ribosome-interacting GTPase 1